jgi:hypothetical protein
MKLGEKLTIEKFRLMRTVSRVRPFPKVFVWFLCFLCVAIFGCQKRYDLNVIASVNGEAIWRSELDRLYKAQQSENDNARWSESRQDRKSVV